MPAKKKRNNKPKSAKKMSQTTTPITIHHSSPTFQYQENQEESFSTHTMEESSNGKLEEPNKEVIVEDDVGVSKIDVESVKTLEIVDDTVETENKKELSILEEIIEKAKKVFDVDDSSSSSSSSDEEEEEEKAEPKPHESETIEKLEDALVEQDFVSNVETELKSKLESDGDVSSDHHVAEDCDEPKNEDSKKIEENIIGEPSKVVYEAQSENVESSQIVETTPSPPVVPVTRDSLQATSWKSCCGLFEVLRRSEQ